MFRVRASYNVWDQLEESLGREKTHYNRKAVSLDWMPRKNTDHLRKMGALLTIVLLALLVLFLPGTQLQAQTGVITGTVVDAYDAAIPGVHFQDCQLGDWRPDS